MSGCRKGARNNCTLVYTASLLLVMGLPNMYVQHHYFISDSTPSLILRSPGIKWKGPKAPTWGLSIILLVTDESLIHLLEEEEE